MSTVTDPIADFLARVRNGARAQKPEVLIPYSKIKADIARIFKEEGYISDYSVDTSGAHPRIKVINKLVDRSSAESKRSAANCWPTSGDDLRSNDLPITISCHESEIKRSRFPTRLK